MSRVYRSIWLWVLVMVAFAGGGPVFAQSAAVPPAPAKYVEDKAGKLSAGVRESLVSQLEQFERETSNQILVALYPNLPRQEELASYSTRVFNAWKVGQKEKNNGAVLFVYVNDRKMFIVTGYGLEGALPDATCRLIIENEIKPLFRAGDFDGGVQAGVSAMIAATKGEYKGTGTTVDGLRKHRSYDWFGLAVLGFIAAIFILNVLSARAAIYSRNGRHPNPWMAAIIAALASGAGSGGRSSGSWGSSSGGGWSSGGSSGGFSSGGGSSGGGGAGGSW